MKNLFTAAFLPVIIFSVISYSSFAQVNLISITNSLEYTGDPGLTTVTITIENTGIGVSGPALVGVYFSLDDTIDPMEDSLIWTMPFGAIYSEALLTIDTSINLCGEILLTCPSYIFGTDFYVGYIIDYSDLVTEINESDNNGIFSQQLFIGCTLGLPKAGESIPFSIYPNPNNGCFIISAPEWVEENGFVSVKNIMNQETVILKESLAINHPLDLSFLSPGWYVVIIQTKKDCFIKWY